MIHYSMFNNFGDRHLPDYDTTDPVVTHKVPGDSVDDLINFLDIRVPHVVDTGRSRYFPDRDAGSIITDSAVCIWWTA